MSTEYDNAILPAKTHPWTRQIGWKSWKPLPGRAGPAELAEYETEAQRLASETINSRPEREAELANLDGQTGLAKAAILKGVDAMIFVENMKIWNERRGILLIEQQAAEAGFAKPELLLEPRSLISGDVRAAYGGLQDETLKMQAFERLRVPIETVVLTPQDGDLVIHLRGELASMLKLCMYGGQATAPNASVVGAVGYLRRTSKSLRGCCCGGFAN